MAVQKAVPKKRANSSTRAQSPRRGAVTPLIALLPKAKRVKVPLELEAFEAALMKARAGTNRPRSGIETMSVTRGGGFPWELDDSDYI